MSISYMSESKENLKYYENPMGPSWARILTRDLPGSLHYGKKKLVQLFTDLNFTRNPFLRVIYELGSTLGP